MRVKLLMVTNKKRIEERTQIVATAGKLSRFPGTVTDVLKSSKEYDKNKKFIERVIKMGHESITDHDYLVFSIENVSPMIEQTIIQERFSSFTIKSRREVNFAKVGFVTPNFRDKNYNVLSNNLELQKKYKKHMKYLFKSYQEFVDLGVKVEDARFILPYSFYSNIIMGVDAHVFKNWIIRLTKGKESNISELKELGERFYKIMEEYVPYLKESIDNYEMNNYDGVEKLLDKYVTNKKYQIIDKVKLLSYTPNADNVIMLSALMRVYGFSYEEAKTEFEKIKDNKDLMREVMKESIKTVDKRELKQVNFGFQFPISFAVLTHFTRHRTHPILVPDFVPIRDLTKYMIPPSIESIAKDKFVGVFDRNVKVYNEFKKMGICDEDLVYFHLAGNLLNITTNFDGGTFAHIMRLRICTKAQWETRALAYQMRDLVREVAPIYGSVLGSDCEIFRICKEGKESCGKLEALLKGDSNEKR